MTRAPLRIEAQLPAPIRSAERRIESQRNAQPQWTRNPMTTPAFTLAIDLDGVIHQNSSPWVDSHVLPDGPVPGAFDFIRHAVESGCQVVIYTARARTASTIPHVYAWLAKHGLEERYTWGMQVTALKPAAAVYIDDRAWRFEGKFPALDMLRELKPWNMLPKDRT